MTRTRIALGYALDELIDHRGKTPSKLGGDWALTGHRVVSALNIKSSRVDENDHHYISTTMYKKWMKVPLQAGDVLLTSEAPTGEVAYLADRHEWAVGQRLFCLRGKPGLLDGRYRFYVLRGGDVRHQLMSRATGTTVSGIRQSELVKVELNLPSIEEQRGIAATLGALDDKIESNRRQLRLTDDLLQALWLKTVDEASESRRLAELVSTQYGLTASSDALAAGPKFLRVKDINKRNWISWTAVPSVDIALNQFSKYQLHKGDLLVARMADPGKSAIFDEKTVEAVFASYLVRLRCANYDESLYVYGFLKSSFYTEYSAGAMTGSVQRNMNARVIVDVDIPWPTIASRAAFAAAAGPLRQLINQRVCENDRLAGVRDGLLPELLSGRIRVPEAQEAVTDAVVS